MAPPKLRQVLAKSASSLTNLGIAGVTAVTAAALASWPILAIGGTAYAALIAWDVANRAGSKLPDPGKVADPELAQALRGMAAARAEIAATLKQTPATVRDNLSGAIGQLDELEKHATILVGRGDDLASYLQTVNRQKIRDERAQLAARAHKATDAEARTQFDDALRTRDEQLKALDDIDGARDRIVAKLATIVATLEALPAKLVRLRAQDAQAIDDLSGSVSEELTRMNGEIRIFEETLAEVGKS